MNADRERPDDDAIHFVLGRAYHTAIFEPEAFDERFVCEPDPEDFPDALMTDAAVKRELKDSGQTQTKTGELAMDRAERLRASGYDGEIWSIIMDRWEAKRNDRQALKARYHRQIMRDIQRIADNPEIHELVTGGFSEVSILWTDPETGIAMKARIDKLKDEYFLDLKSFTNTRRKPVNQCIFDQVQYERHYIQARLYQRAIDAIHELDIVGDFTQEQNDLIRRIKERAGPLRCWYLYQEKNGVPNLLAREMKLQRWPEGNDWNSIGASSQPQDFNSVLSIKADLEIARARQLYQQALEVYGTDQPWYPFDMIGEIGDEDFSEYFLDSKPA